MKLLFFSLSLLLKTIAQYRLVSKSLKNYFPQNSSKKARNKAILYALVVSNVVGFPFAKIGNIDITDDKKQLIRLNAGLIPLIDLITDKYERLKNGETQLQYFYNNYLSIEPVDEIENSFKLIVLKICELTQNSSTVQESLKATLHAQIESIKQLNNPHEKDLRKLLADKGGLAFVQFATCINSNLNVSERDAIYQCGFFLQLINDLVDIKKDKLNGVSTLATHKDSIQYDKILKTEMAVMESLIMDIDSKKEIKEAFLHNILNFSKLQILLRKLS